MGSRFYVVQLLLFLLQNFRYLLVGYRESSFIRLSNKSYIYYQHTQPKFIYPLPKELLSQMNRFKTIKKVYIGQNPYLLQESKLGKPVLRLAKPDGYSIMKTPCFVHKAYLEMYFDPLMVPAGAVEYVEKQKICEDILLSIVVTKFVQDINLTHYGVLAVNGPPTKGKPGTQSFFN